MSKDESYSSKETADRFKKILRGAMHKPTSLKDIPKKRGGSRKPNRSAEKNR